MFAYEKYKACLETLLYVFRDPSQHHAMRRQDISLCLMGLERIEKNYSRAIIDASTADEEARMLLSRWI